MLIEKRNFISEYKNPFIVTILFAFISIYFQTYLFGSTMVQDEELWVNRLNLHLEWAPFSHRLFQNYATLLLNKIFGLPIKESFFTIQYLLFVFMGLFFYKYLRLLSFSKLWSNIGIMLLLTAYPILGAHCPPVYTWDDLWANLFVIIMIIYLIKDNWKIVGLFFFLGLMAREQTIVFYPIMLLMIYDKRIDKINLKSIFFISAPIVIYVLYRLFIWEDIDPTRWNLLEYNFAKPTRTNDTLISLFLSFGFIWFIFFTGFIKLAYQKVFKERRLLLFGSASTLILTLIIALFLTFVRETRILFPPFVFIIPVALLSLKSLTTLKKRNMEYVKYILSAILSIFIIVTCNDYISALDIKPDFWSGFDFRILLVGIHVGIIVTLISIYLIRRVEVYLSWIEAKIEKRFKKYSKYFDILKPLIVFILIIGTYNIFKNPEPIRFVSEFNTVENKIEIVNIEVGISNGNPRSLNFKFAALEDMSDDYRIYLHLLKEDAIEMINLDFVPYPKVSDWKVNEVVNLKRAINLKPGRYNCKFGFFNENGRMGLPFKFKLYIP